MSKSSNRLIILKRDSFISAKKTIKLSLEQYQREFVWEKIDIQHFIKSVLNNRFFGLGTVDGKDHSFEVVDGQQRLITSTILIFASFLYEGKLKEMKPKVIVNFGCHETFWKMVSLQEKNQSDKTNIKQSYYFKKIDELINDVVFFKSKLAIINNEIDKINKSNSEKYEATTGLHGSEMQKLIFSNNLPTNLSHPYQDLLRAPEKKRIKKINEILKDIEDEKDQIISFSKNIELTFYKLSGSNIADSFVWMNFKGRKITRAHFYKNFLIASKNINDSHLKSNWDSIINSYYAIKSASPMIKFDTLIEQSYNSRINIREKEKVNYKNELFSKKVDNDIKKEIKSMRMTLPELKSIKDNLVFSENNLILGLNERTKKLTNLNYKLNGSYFAVNVPVMYKIQNEYKNSTSKPDIRFKQAMSLLSIINILFSLYDKKLSVEKYKDDLYNFMGNNDILTNKESLKVMFDSLFINLTDYLRNNEQLKLKSIELDKFNIHYCGKDKTKNIDADSATIFSASIYWLLKKNIYNFDDWYRFTETIFKNKPIYSIEHMMGKNINSNILSCCLLPSDLNNIFKEPKYQNSYKDMLNVIKVYKDTINNKIEIQKNTTLKYSDYKITKKEFETINNVIENNATDETLKKKSKSLECVLEEYKKIRNVNWTDSAEQNYQNILLNLQEKLLSWNKTPK